MGVHIAAAATAAAAALTVGRGHAGRARGARRRGRGSSPRFGARDLLASALQLRAVATKAKGRKVKEAPGAAPVALDNGKSMRKKAKALISTGTGTAAPQPMKGIDQTIRSINSLLGDGTMRLMSDETHQHEADVFSTGILSLDLAMGGGWPKGRIVEIFGPEASGKTTLALHAIAEVNDAGGHAAIVDVEHALDMDYAKEIGVNPDLVTLSQPDSAERALEIVLKCAESYNLVVLDSVAALVPLEEIAKDMEQASIGLTARLMSKVLRKLTPVASKSGCTVIFINQLRANISSYGAPEITTGGSALKYYSSMRVEVRAPKSGFLKRPGQEEPYGCRTKAKVVKNKLFTPHKTAEFDVIFGKGASKESAILEAALKAGIVEKKGAWLQYKELRVQGREKFAEEILKEPALMRELDGLAREHLTKGGGAAATADGAETEDGTPAEEDET